MDNNVTNNDKEEFADDPMIQLDQWSNWVFNEFSFEIALDIWGIKKGKHLWEKYTEAYRRNFLLLWTSLSADNKEMFSIWYIRRVR